MRKGVLQDLGVLRYSTPVRRGVAQGDPCAHRPRFPAAVSRDSRSEPSIPIDRGQQLLHVDDGGLQLDDEQRAGRGMEGKDVDDAPLAVDREGRLRGQKPWRSGEESRDLLMEGGMPGVQHPIEVATSPPRHDVKADLECLRHAQEHAEAEVPEVAAFHARNHRLGHAGDSGDIGLAPTGANSDGTDHGPQPHHVHGVGVWLDEVTGRLPRHYLILVRYAPDDY